MKNSKPFPKADCNHPDCVAKLEYHKTIVRALEAGEATKEQQEAAGANLHDALLLIHALPQQLVDAIIQSHGMGIMIAGGSSFDEAKANLQAQNALNAGAWPAKGSEKGN